MSNFSLHNEVAHNGANLSSTSCYPLQLAPPASSWYSSSAAVYLSWLVSLCCLFGSVAFFLWSRRRLPSGANGIAPTGEEDTIVPDALPFQLLLSPPPTPSRRQTSEALLSPRAVYWHYEDDEEEYERMKSALLAPAPAPTHKRSPSPLLTSFSPATYSSHQAPLPAILPEQGTTFSSPSARLAIHIASHLPLSTLLCEVSALNSSWRYSLYRHPLSHLAFVHLPPVCVHRSEKSITIDGQLIDVSNTPSYFASSSVSLSSTAATLLSSTLRFLPHIHYRSSLSLSSALTTIIPALCTLSQLRWLRLDDERAEVLLHLVMKVRRELQGLEVVSDVSRTDARMIRRALQSVVDRPLVHLALTHTLADAFLYRMTTLKPSPVIANTLESIQLTFKRSSLYPVNADAQLRQLAAIPRLRLLHLAFTSPAQYQPSLTGWCALANLSSLTHLVCPLFSSQQLTLLSTLPSLTSLHFTPYVWCAVPSLSPLLSLSSLQALTLDVSLPSLDSLLLFPSSLSFLSVSLSAETRANNTSWMKRLLSWQGLTGLKWLEVVGTAYACDETAVEVLTVVGDGRVGDIKGGRMVCDRLQRLCLRGGVSALWSDRVRAGLTRRFGVCDERNREGVRWWTEEAVWRRANGLPPSRVDT